MAKKECSIKWRIFNAAIEFLETRKLAKDVYGCDADGNVLEWDAIYRNPEKIVCACAGGALWGGAGSIGAAKDDADACHDDLTELVPNPFNFVLRT